MKTFARFLDQCIEDQAEVRLVPVRVGNLIRFYAHPQGVDGDTVDFEVRGNTLVPLRFSAYSKKESDF